MFIGGEQGLPAWGVCNLSAINLSKFYDENTNDIAWDDLKETVHISTRFLDNVIDATPYHFEENKKNQKNERRVGLGTMGLAELLIKLGVRYGSAESLELLDKLYGFIAVETYKASIDIAEEKGSFPAWKKNEYLVNHDAGCNTFAGDIMYEMEDDYRNRYFKTGIRNVTIITQAPTGSTGTMVGTSTGIEPYYAFEYIRQSRLGTDKQYVGIAKDWIEQHPNQPLPDYFATAQDLSAEDHVRVQAVIQKWVDSSISKTANAPNSFTVEDTSRLYQLAYDLGCKGVTIYRDGSRDVQVLNLEKEEKKEEEIVVSKKKLIKRQHELDGKTYKYKTPVGTAYITVNVDEDGKPIELLVNVGKAGSAISAMSEAIGRAGSLFLRFGDLPNKDNANLLIEHFSGIGSNEQVAGFGISKADSIPDAIARAVKEYTTQNSVEDSEIEVEAEVKITNTSKKNTDICPKCSNFTMVHEEGCKHCISCGFSKCS